MQVAHGIGKPFTLRLDDRVIVVAHKAVCDPPQAVAVADLLHPIYERDSVSVVPKERLPIATTRHEVIDPIDLEHSCSAPHGVDDNCLIRQQTGC